VRAPQPAALQSPALAQRTRLPPPPRAPPPARTCAPDPVYPPPCCTVEDSLIQNNRFVGDNAMSAATNDDITDTPVFI